MQQKVLSLILDTAGSASTVLQSVPVANVKLTDRFWTSKLHINRTVSIRQQYQKLADTGRLDNFYRLTQGLDKPFTAPVFNDSDIYKWLEAAAWALASAADPELWQLMDETINLVVNAQSQEGYINTYYALDRQNERWSNIRDMHELYCAGHLIQAAVAIHRCLGDSRLLNCAISFADYLDTTYRILFNNEIIPPGHPVIEMALVELARETKDQRYLNLAQEFLNARGKGLIGGREYHQDHQPFRDLQRLTGHAVRALYLCSGAADIALETGEVALRQTLQRLWEHMVARVMYITGGVGARHSGEAIGDDYELPNAQAYAETCASIAAVMWAWRMLQLEPDSQYADYIEHILYNAILPAVSMDGTSYFYVNPLTDDGTHQRASWFDCACCPPNLARTLAMLPGMMYSVSDNTIWIHQFAANEASITLPDGEKVAVLQRTRYPWDGNVIIEILDEKAFDLKIRIPKWCNSTIEMNINGNTYSEPIVPGTYLHLSRSWSVGDSVCIQFPMPVRKMKAHPYVRENLNQVALMRGPILFCLEAADNLNMNLMDVILGRENAITSQYLPQLLGGLQVLEIPGFVSSPDTLWNKNLYLDIQELNPPADNSKVALKAIPYFAWGNRQTGQMLIWLPESGG